MKVMQLLPELNSGGVERGTLEIAQALVVAGHQSIVVSNGGRLVPSLEAAGTKHMQLPIHKKALASLWQIRPLRALIVAEQPDIVHVRSRVPAWLTYLAIKKIPAAKRPHWVSTVHGFYSVNRYSAIMVAAESVIAVSNSVVDYITQNYPQCNPAKITRIYRGIEPEQFPYGFKPTAQWWRTVLKQYPQLESKIWLTLPGRITRLKGHEALINLIQALKDDYPLVHAVIVGGADPKKQAYLDELQNKVQALGLQDYVTFVGHQSDIRNWLAASYMVLSLSSQAETFGRTVLEAIALGVPVVGYARGGVAEVLEQSYPFGLVEADNFDALVGKVTSLLNQPIKPEKLTQFSLKQMTDQTLALYQRIVSSRRLF